nr:uncharacterized protein LOC112293212 isoform X1 [Physcomitrium patens]XP_024398162.1 uncharacterized protein LOC112293212 isoform X1 [Physcomitrium patens]|eukprot:XP_024398161.1 uncharacterized protein LOC112293212 isoform X1 [Physcomitrella patens]
MFANAWVVGRDWHADGEVENSWLKEALVSQAYIGGSQKSNVVETMAKTAPGLALLGSGIFASSQYLPKLGELSEVISLRVIWSRSEDGAKKALLSARSYAPNVEAKWGQEGLEAILQDKSIQAVAIVLPAQHQLELVLRALEAGKHVIQEKPVGASVADVRKAWSTYQALAVNDKKLPIWAVAENYRFEPALIQTGKFAKEIGQIMGVQVLIEAPINSSSPYFSSSWRRDKNFKVENLTFMRQYSGARVLKCNFWSSLIYEIAHDANLLISLV